MEYIRFGTEASNTSFKLN